MGMGHWLRTAALTLMVVTLVGCTASKPAPVSVIDTTPVKRLPKGSLKSSSYVVQSGDTLYSIAFASGKDYRTLARINKLPSNFTIFPGQRLSLVESPKKSKPKVTRSPKPKPAPKSSSKATQTAKTTTTKPKTAAKPPVEQSKQERYAAKPSAQKSSKPESRPAPPKPLPAKVSRWNWPVKGTVIRGFSNAEQGNKGLDIAAAEGTAVTSSAAGRVVYAGNALRGYGQLVIVKHSDDYLSAYAHNSRILVKEKQQVSAGQKIAEVGHTDADRNMLHFEIRYQGKSVDPMRYLPRR